MQNKGNKMSEEEYIYLPYKFFLHDNNLERFIKEDSTIGENHAPVSFEVDLLSFCIDNCVFCIYRNADNEGLDLVDVRTPSIRDYERNMSRDVAFDVMRQIKLIGSKSVAIKGEGESTLAPYFGDLLEYIGELKLKYAIVSNGAGMTRKRQERINPDYIEWIRFSMDSCDDETHKKIHRSKHKKAFERRLENLRTTVELKKNWNDDFLLGVSYIVVPKNIHSIARATLFYRELGVDYIMFKFMHRPREETVISSITGRLEEEFRIAKSYETNSFRVHGGISRYGDEDHGNDFKECGSQYFSTSITADGEVYPCCVLKGIKEFSMGNIKRTPLREILSEHNPNFNPKQCPPCYLTAKNTTLSAYKHGLLGERERKLIRDYVAMEHHLHGDFP